VGFKLTTQIFDNKTHLFFVPFVLKDFLNTKNKKFHAKLEKGRKGDQEACPKKESTSNAEANSLSVETAQFSRRRHNVAKFFVFFVGQTRKRGLSLYGSMISLSQQGRGTRLGQTGWKRPGPNRYTSFRLPRGFAI
jgi:hypothetical protein